MKTCTGEAGDGLLIQVGPELTHHLFNKKPERTPPFVKFPWGGGRGRKSSEVVRTLVLQRSWILLCDLHS